jgi:hypothetical protein
MNMGSIDVLSLQAEIYYERKCITTLRGWEDCWIIVSQTLGITAQQSSPPRKEW